MAGLFKISDQSATNSRGAYADMLLDYDQIQDTKPDGQHGEVAPEVDDSQMVVSEEKEASSNSNGEPQLSRYVIFRLLRQHTFSSPGIYDSLCALQRFFSNPVALTNPSTGENGRTGLEEFKHRTEIITSAFTSHAVRQSSQAADTSDLFVPRYIPSKDAAEFQVCSTAALPPLDPTDIIVLCFQLTEQEFRRQICVQLLVILQQIQNLHIKDKSRHPKDLHFPATFSVETDDVRPKCHRSHSVANYCPVLSTNGPEDSQLRFMLTYSKCRGERTLIH
jgi:hypothetical protein